jgi:hypothetical protein
MFVLFLLAPGALLTMHMYVKPKEKAGVRTTKFPRWLYRTKDDPPFPARTIAIWVFGLLASGLFGALILKDVAGYFAGMFAFACLRLWLARPSS